MLLVYYTEISVATVYTSTDDDSSFTTTVLIAGVVAVVLIIAIIFIIIIVALLVLKSWCGEFSVTGKMHASLQWSYSAEC